MAFAEGAHPSPPTPWPELAASLAASPSWAGRYKPDGSFSLTESGKHQAGADFGDVEDSRARSVRLLGPPALAAVMSNHLMTHDDAFEDTMIGDNRASR